jgi:hypothetical protein
MDDDFLMAPADGPLSWTTELALVWPIMRLLEIMPSVVGSVIVVCNAFDAASDADCGL